MLYSNQQREVVQTERQREVVYTKRQRELLRTRVDAYRQAHGRTWKGLCDEIFDLTGVHVRDEDLRQWVERFIAKTRKSSRRPNEAELKGIASFLMDPSIDMLSEKEVNEPEIPYRFARFLLDFLAHPGYKQLSPPQALSGQYRAYFKSTDGSIDRKVELTLQVHEGDHVIRVTEEAWTYFMDADSKTFKLLPAEPELGATHRADGWGVVTPEDNLLIFMKNERYGHNHYYLTIVLYPSIWSKTSISQMALLRHGYPVPDRSDHKSFEELMSDPDGDTVLLHFYRT